jgi:hypoxanthine phosphoribosyltransferase
MKLRKRFLYKKLNDAVLVEYSKFKFGDTNTVEFLAEKISKTIRKEMLNDNKYVLYTTNKFPTKSYYRKNSLILSNAISKKLKLPLIIGEYKYKYKENEFYDNQVKRRIHLPKIKQKQKSKYSKGYIFLMIDDSMFTGATLKASLDELKNITNEVIFFSVINLNKNKYSEKEVNGMFIKKFGAMAIWEILNSKNYYVFTTHILRTIDKLKKRERAWILENINEKKKKILVKSFKEYIGKDLVDLNTRRY